MIDIVKVGGSDYPFLFGMRVFWQLTNSGEIEFNEVDGRIQSDYQTFLDLFVLANEAAIDRSGEGNELNRRTLEQAIDDDPVLLKTLQGKLQNSSVIKKAQKAHEEETEGNVKKPKS